MMQTIKKILAKNKNACVIIMEDNEPAFVVTSFEEYERMADNANEDFLTDDFSPEAVEDILEEVNSEIINLGAPQDEADSKEQSMQVVEENPQEMSMQEIKIEDIPL